MELVCQIELYMCVFHPCYCFILAVFVNRAINYDERDPFMCNACGYSKYAKFEVTVEGRPCSAVDPIESEEDRKKVGFHVCDGQFYLLVNLFLLYSDLEQHQRPAGACGPGLQDDGQLPQ